MDSSNRFGAVVEDVDVEIDFEIFENDMLTITYITQENYVVNVEIEKAIT